MVLKNGLYAAIPYQSVVYMAIANCCFGKTRVGKFSFLMYYSEKTWNFDGKCVPLRGIWMI
ncbi:MAG: hypothetical protein IJV27_06790 [Prevotella sp.]|nr:hypothetical protein [Prevotella sp.]